MAQSYPFEETRYSYALDRSKTLKGIISFKEDELRISYDDSGKALFYDTMGIEFTDDGEKILLSETESLKLIQYFDIIMMINSNDEVELKEHFTFESRGKLLSLIPKPDLDEYLNRIDVRREGEKLKELTMFLSNNDRVLISIDNEIR